MSVYNPQINQSFLEKLDLMSTDIRAQKKAIADALSAAQLAQGTANSAVTVGNTAKATADNALTIGNTAQAAADAAASALQVVSGTVQTISMDMVRKFTSAPIDAAAFILDAVTGYYYATVSHMLGDSAPDVEVFDAGKDKQAVQSILVDINTIKLELTAADMQSNQFPLTCICLGKTEPVIPSSDWIGTSNTIQKFRLRDREIDVTEDNGVTFANLYSDVDEAFVESSSNQIYLIQQLENSAPQCFRESIGSDGGGIAITLAEYDLAKALSTAVLLPTTVV